MSWSLLSGIFFFGTECLALFLLISVPDIPNYLLGIVALGYLWRKLFKPLSARLSTGISIFVVVACGYALLFSHLPQASILGPGLILLHATLTAAGQYSSFRYWRIGISFLEVLLASVLYPEAQMFFGIFLFVLFSSLSMSFGFVENELVAAHADLEKSKPKLKLVGQLFIISTLIFLTSLLIFPILPRSQWAGIGGGAMVNPGFTETISLQNSSLQWGKGSNEIMVTIILPKNISRPVLIPFGLLRMNVLDITDGMDWVYLPRKTERIDFKESQNDPQIEIVRERLPSGVLPMPYFFEPVLENGKWIQKSSSGEWMAPGFFQSKVKYKWKSTVPAIKDQPTKEHLIFPKTQYGRKFLTLLPDIPAQEDSLEAKVGWIRKYFAEFSYNVSYQAPSNSDSILEDFLKNKAGHCELFAATTALYFRALGVPSRIVTGFRMGNLERTITLVRSSQAHAWVEIWDQKRQLWTPLDFTPPAPPQYLWLSGLQDSYDFVLGNWNRYVLNFEWEKVDFKGWLRILPWLFGLVGIVGLGSFLRRKNYEKEESSRPEVTAIWVRASRKIVKKGKDPEKVWPLLPESLRTDYLKYRFSATKVSKNELNILEEKFDSELGKSLEFQNQKTL